MREVGDAEGGGPDSIPGPYWQTPGSRQDSPAPHRSGNRAAQGHQSPSGQQNCQPQSLQLRQSVPLPFPQAGQLQLLSQMRNPHSLQSPRSPGLHAPWPSQAPHWHWSVHRWVPHRSHARVSPGMHAPPAPAHPLHAPQLPSAWQVRDSVPPQPPAHGRSSVEPGEQPRQSPFWHTLPPAHGCAPPH